MIDFIERGHDTFRHGPDITLFRQTSHARERERLDRIYRHIPLDSRFATTAGQDLATRPG